MISTKQVDRVMQFRDFIGLESVTSSYHSINTKSMELSKMRDSKGRFVKGISSWNKGIKGKPKSNKKSCICPYCEKYFLVQIYRKRKYCSNKCKCNSMKGNIPWNKGKKLSEETKKKISKANKGKHNSPVTEFKKGKNLRENHPNWKGGKIKHSGGYILVHKPTHPSSDCYGYVVEHRLVMEKKSGRYLKPEEVVHHLDFDKTNNHPDNLHLFSNNSKHTKYHQFLRDCVREEIKRNKIES